jgi:aldehyde dehydrogenase (NAD+)
VDAAVAKAKELDADCIVSVGGGSVIDTGKAVAVTLKNGGMVNDHVAIMRLTEPQTPHIAVPTTAGTGSEVTNAAVITSPKAGRKVYIVDSYIIPNAAILDPRFTMTLPPALTAGTAMDAMTHAVEALTSTLAQPICDGLALQAIRLIRENLPLVIADPNDEQARLNMAIGATMAGQAFTVAQVGLAHSMSHTMGVLNHVHHGTACGIVLPKVMRFNVDHAASKLALAAAALGVDTADLNERDAALAAAEEIESLMEAVGHPTRLRDIGVPDGDFQIAAFHAVADTPTLFNARPVGGPGEVVELFAEAY